MEELDIKEYDVLVLGTGVPESILASALAKDGKTLLHIDERAHYGGLWSSFQLHFLVTFFQTQNKKEQDPRINPYSSSLFKFPCLELAALLVDAKFSMQNQLMTTEATSCEEPDISSKTCEKDILAVIQNLVKNLFSLSENSDYEPLFKYLSKYAVEKAVLPFLNSFGESSPISLQLLTQEIAKRINQILSDSRKYCLELVSKQLMSDGSLVSLFIDSGVNNYLEFKLVKQTEIFQADKYKKVPLSKEDVFVDEEMSLIEKRKLMKFLMFAMEYNNQPEVWKDKKDTSFSKFLVEEFKLKTEMIEAVIHCIALSYGGESPVSVELGLSNVQLFIQSLGKFGNHSLLWTVYGAGSEISQAFCRMSALHHGIYMLSHKISRIEPLVKTGDNLYQFKITDSMGQHVKAKNLLLNIDYIPQELLPEVNISGFVTRMIVALEGISLPPDQEVVFMVYPDGENKNTSAKFALLLSEGTSSCPQGQALIYLWSYSTSLPRIDPQEELTPFFNSIMSRPALKNPESRIVFQISYNQAIRKYNSSNVPKSSTFANLIVIDDPTQDLVLEGLQSSLEQHYSALGLGPKLFAQEKTPDLLGQANTSAMP